MRISTIGGAAALSALILLGACGGGDDSSDTPAPETNTTSSTVSDVDSPPEVEVEEPAEPEFDFDASRFGLGSQAADIEDSNRVTIQDDGLLVNARGPFPVVALKETVPADPDAVYRVDVVYDLVEVEGEPVADIFAYALDGEGEDVSDDAFSATFHSRNVTEPGRYEIFALYSLSPSDDPMVKVFEVPEGTERLRFTTNPVREGTGSIAIIRDMRVSRVTE
jgi:hypothetical protein